MSLELLLWIIFLFCTLIQLLFWLGIFWPFSISKTKSLVPLEETSEPVSVIICAHNEAANLQAFLPDILKQEYTAFEVIVMDDHSTDNTWQVLQDLAKHYAQLRIFRLHHDKDEYPGKKWALQQGIQHAQNDLLLLTDADCMPASRLWIKLMAQACSPTRPIVLGYGGYEGLPGSLNTFIQYETAFTALKYFSLARIGLPYMAVGRNLAYRKSFFNQHDGFIGHLDLAGGDDDLFVNAHATSSNINYLTDPNAFTFSIPKKDFSSWKAQKTRHSGVGKRYRWKHKIILGLFSLTHSGHFISAFFLLFLNLSIIFVLLLIILRTTIVFFTFSLIFKKFAIPKKAGWVPFLDILNISYELFLLRAILKQKQNYWT